MKRVHYSIIETECGRVWFGGTEEGVSSIVLGSTPKMRKVAKLFSTREVKLIRDEKMFKNFKRALQRYFRGENVDFDPKLDMKSATPFQKKVWGVVRKIPYGELRSYKEVAKSCGGAKYARAVGTAMRTNQFPLVIPCHRVIGSDGSLVGFGSGLRWKRALILLEGGQLPLRL